MNLSVIVSRVESTYHAADQDMTCLKKVCRKGCDACCYQITPANTWEEIKIVEFIHKRLDFRTKAVLRKNLEEWFARFNGATREASKTSPLTPIEMNLMEHLFREQRVPCPMLMECTCTIYEVRPLACRVHIEPDDLANCRNDPHKITTSEARSIYKKSLKAFDPRIFHLQNKPVAYAVAGELEPNVSAKPFLNLGVDLRQQSR